jgi:signal transduction histidine kinase
MEPESRVSILLVDDLPENLLALEAILESLGQKLVRASSGAEALKCVLGDDFALILLDVQMPEMDGFEVARLIRSRERSRRTPIVFITAISKTEEHILHGYALGAADYVLKPVVPQVLQAKVTAFVELAKLTHERQIEIAHRQRAEEALRRLNEDLEHRITERTADLESAHLGLEHLYQELLEASRRKDEYLAMLAHELRNPLGAVSNALVVMRTSTQDSSAFRRAEATARRQVEHQTRIVQDLLDVSRLMRGTLELRHERLDLARLVRETVEDYRSMVEGAGLSLREDVPRQAIAVEGDRTRLAQVLANLLDDAAKFTPPGGEVTVRLTLEAGSGKAVVVVTDTGVGMAGELLSRIFAPFDQADRSLDRSGGGLGLGLALVKSLVELHRGTVRAHSGGVGCGSTFTFVLPVSTEAPALRDDTPSTPPVARPVRVLVVEDNRDAAETLRDILELLGHEVALAYTGPQGLQAARKFRPEVILCDIGLPGMDGYQVASEFRQDPDTASARLIAITGYGGAEDRRRSREVGYHHHLVKPVDPEELGRLLAGVAEG